MPKTDLDIDALRTDLSKGIVGSRILYFDSLPSTMDRARAEAESGTAEGSVIVAEEQTKGRGRFQRQWLSPKGHNLLFSVVFRPSLEQLNQMNMASSLTVTLALSRLANTEATIKWPNDIRISGKKIAGVLIESTLEASNVKYAVVGIGINVNWSPPPESKLIYPATSLAEQIGKTTSRTDVLRAVLKELNTLYAQVKSGNSVREQWSKRLDTIGQHVRVGMGNDTLEGIAKDVDDKGNLVIQRTDGSTVAVAAGEVTLRT